MCFHWLTEMFSSWTNFFIILTWMFLFSGYWVPDWAQPSARHGRWCGKILVPRGRPQQDSHRRLPGREVMPATQLLLVDRSEMFSGGVSWLILLFYSALFIYYDFVMVYLYSTYHTTCTCSRCRYFFPCNKEVLHPYVLILPDIVIRAVTMHHMDCNGWVSDSN